jgi:hypothetical protein
MFVDARLLPSDLSAAITTGAAAALEALDARARATG